MRTKFLLMLALCSVQCFPVQPVHAERGLRCICHTKCRIDPAGHSICSTECRGSCG
ncbi:MAG: hypothetical protein RLZZ450_99 [Pseudomonadota bacterium]|jgi:hypothetical protein